MASRKDIPKPKLEIPSKPAKISKSKKKAREKLVDKLDEGPLF